MLGLLFCATPSEKMYDKQAFLFRYFFPLVHDHTFCLKYRMSQFLMEHWMVVGILAPCIVALYLILIMVGYHIFCKRQETESNHDNVFPNGQIEVSIAQLYQIHTSLTV